MRKNVAESVFLCRTPLQAKICMAIVEREKINDFDVIYFTQNDNESDRLYFSMLSKKSKNSVYIYIKKQSKDILNHLFSIISLKKRYYSNSYEKIYIASIDSFLFRFIVKQNPSAVLLGFDDGSANITSSSIYYDLDKYKRSELYARILGLPRVIDLKLKIIKHYSIYSGFENIVDKNKIQYINVFSQNVKENSSCKNKLATYFIGQPFNEYLSAKQIDKIKKWLEDKVIDYYVMHPRENEPLIKNIPILDKRGMLAEDAIFKSAGDSKVRIISAYSTVLFNVSCKYAEKIYLSISDDANENERLYLVGKTGSKVIILA